MASSPAATRGAAVHPPPAGRPSAVRPRVRQPAASTASAPPRQSSGPVSSPLLSGTWARARTTTATDSGRLSQKAARQPSVSISMPPSAGPMAVVIADAPAHVPMARPRRSGGKAAERIARLCGTRSAAPKPWTARAAISQPTVGARAQASEASANTTVPVSNSRRRPNRSPAAPPTRISEPRKRVYPFTTHCSAPRLASSPRCITGSAIVTTVASMNAIAEARMVAASTHRRDAATHGVPWPPGCAADSWLTEAPLGSNRPKP